MLVWGIVNTVYELRVCSVPMTLYKEENMNAWNDLFPLVLCGVCVMCTGTCVSRGQIVHLVFSSLPLYESCLNQVFPHFSSIILFHFISSHLCLAHPHSSVEVKIMSVGCSSGIKQTWMLKDVCCTSHAFLVTLFWAGPCAPWEGQNFFLNTYSFCLSSHGLVTSLPIILWSTGNSFLLGGSAELFCWLLCALSTIVLATISHVEKLLALDSQLFYFHDSVLCTVSACCASLSPIVE